MPSHSTRLNHSGRASQVWMLRSTAHESSWCPALDQNRLQVLDDRALVRVRTASCRTRARRCRCPAASVSNAEEALSVGRRHVRDEADASADRTRRSRDRTPRAAVRRRLQQVAERRHRAVVQVRRAQPDAVERMVRVAVRLPEVREAVRRVRDTARTGSRRTRPCTSRADAGRCRSGRSAPPARRARPTSRRRGSDGRRGTRRTALVERGALRVASARRSDTGTSAAAASRSSRARA